ncbi:aminoglycoside phosphotransferase [Saccharopolyspora pogona]|uniref:aminoglycoside phosphotransferase n=1 Tax=Saccharopolyspora pogona TaxID=333966 RepID=UPI001CC232C0|nr:aminoglycoside phosphotransferase [Saccharopolyspora pogona]
MTLARLDWQELPPHVRDVIMSRTGPVLAAQTLSAGKNSAIALLVETRDGRVFVKGLHRDHPGVVTQAREAIIAPYVAAVSPRLLWRVEVDGWDLIGVEYIDGRHADYRPGSPDLPAVVDVMRRLGAVECPDLPELKSPAQRWRAYVDDPADLEWFAGSTLLHTDYNPLNVIIDDQGTAHLIDWAWPTRGAAFIDPAVLVYRLMSEGHTAASAESWVSDTPAWTAAPEKAVDLFARANARVWEQIARDDPHPWKQCMAAITREWSESRRGTVTASR